MSLVVVVVVVKLVVVESLVVVSLVAATAQQLAQAAPHSTNFATICKRRHGYNNYLPWYLVHMVRMESMIS